MARILESITILRILQNGGLISAEALAQQLGTSKKTVYRAMESLNKVGFPIESVRGKYGGFRLNSCVRLFREMDAEDLALVLLAGEMLVQEENFPQRERLKLALEKVSRAANAALPPDSGAMCKAHVHFLGSRHRLSNLNEATILTINRNIYAHKVLRLKYFSRSGNIVSERLVAPYELFMRDGFWYLVGHCYNHQQLRTFRVDRIQGVESTLEGFARPQSFTLAEYLKNSWGIERGKEVKVRVIFNSEVAHLIREVKWHQSQKLVDLQDGRLEFTAIMQGINEFLHWLLGFGASAELVEPAELRARVVWEAQAMVRIYERQGEVGVAVNKRAAGVRGSSHTKSD